MTISLHAMTGNKLNINYLTGQPSDLLASKNVLPSCEYLRYTTNVAQIANNASATIQSNAIQFSQISNRIFIVAKKPSSAQTIKDSNCYLPITGVNINFNNLNGILSGATVNDLYNLSRRNGSKQELYEFHGYASVGLGMSAGTTGSILAIKICIYQTI